LVDTLQLIAATITIILSVAASAISMAYWLGRRFTEIDARFRSLEARVDGIERRLSRVESRLDRVEERLNRVEERLSRVESRLDAMEERFKLIDERFKAIDERFKAIDERFKSIDSRFDELKAYVDGKFSELRGYVDRRFERLSEANVGFYELLLDFLGLRGVVGEPEARFLKREAGRLFKMATLNPLTKEEWEKIKEYFEKEELTVDEAMEFRELTRKVVKEYWMYPEAWKLHYYACIMVGIALRKQMLEEEKKKSQKTQA